jgi:hypothetical protein
LRCSTPVSFMSSLFSKLSDPDKSVDLKSLAAGIHSKLPKYARPLFLRRMTKVNNYFLSIHIFFWLGGSRADAQNKESLIRLYSIRS